MLALFDSLIPFLGRITNFGQNKGCMHIHFRKSFLADIIFFPANSWLKKIVSYKENCNIQFSKKDLRRHLAIFYSKIFGLMLIFYACAKFILILEFDLGPCLVLSNGITLLFNFLMLLCKLTPNPKLEMSINVVNFCNQLFNFK